MSTKTHSLQTAVQSTGLDVIMLAEYGSRAHGTAVEESDRDLLGIYVEHDYQIYGLDRAGSQNYRLHGDGTLEAMGQSPNESCSGADDIEIQLHPLRKFVSLAAAGNPTFLSLLWSPGFLIDSDANGLLIGSRNMFLSKHAGYRHAGYGRSQRNALLGLTNKRTNRPALIEEMGYDTKYAAHMIRGLLAGLDLVRERTFHLPMKPEQLALLGEIRRGEIPLQDVLTLSEKLENDLTDETEASHLPDSTEPQVMNDLLRLIRIEHLSR